MMAESEDELPDLPSPSLNLSKQQDKISYDSTPKSHGAVTKKCKRAARSTTRRVKISSHTHGKSSFKLMIMQLCVSKDLLNVTPNFTKDKSRHDCIQMMHKIDALLDSWKIVTRAKISREMDIIRESLEFILHSKLEKVLLLLQEILCKNQSGLSDIDKWIINCVMLSQVEVELSLKENTVATYQQREQELTYIKNYFSDSPQETYINIEKQKCYSRYLKAKEDKLSRRIAKVLYYLRNFYLERDESSWTSWPNFIIQLMCGYDPEDEELDNKYSSKVHSTVNCTRMNVFLKGCQLRHFDFEALDYDSTEPTYAEVYDYIVKAVSQ